MGYFLEKISDDDIKDIGLIVRDGGRVYGTNDSYLVMHDDEEILYDDTYACHYEIIQIFKNDIKHGNHLAGNIYVEIHFENPTNSKCFVPVIKSLIDNDKELENFCWRRYCPGLRLKNSIFTENDTKEAILKNLIKLKIKTIDVLKKTYSEYLSQKSFTPSFVLGNYNRKTSETRNIKKYSCELDEITIVHELIKEKLIKDIEDNPGIIDINDPIDIKSIYRENLVNGNNFIDLVAKTKDEKIIFFEIKTSQDPRLCIRQALGQLMEYAYYPNVKHADKLVIVGPCPGNGDIKKYIKKINQDFNLDLQYLPCTNFLK